MVVGNTIVWFQAVTNHINLQNNLDSILFWQNLFVENNNSYETKAPIVSN